MNNPGPQRRPKPATNANAPAPEDLLRQLRDRNPDAYRHLVAVIRALAQK